MVCCVQYSILSNTTVIICNFVGEIWKEFSSNLYHGWSCLWLSITLAAQQSIAKLAILIKRHSSWRPGGDMWGCYRGYRGRLCSHGVSALIAAAARTRHSCGSRWFFKWPQANQMIGQPPPGWVMPANEPRTSSSNFLIFFHRFCMFVYQSSFSIRHWYVICPVGVRVPEARQLLSLAAARQL